jgi:hypothetical protein
MKAQAEEVLATLSKADPTFALYDEIRNHAENNIERSLQRDEQWPKRTAMNSHCVIQSVSDGSDFSERQFRATRPRRVNWTRQ